MCGAHTGRREHVRWWIKSGVFVLLSETIIELCARLGVCAGVKEL